MAFPTTSVIDDFNRADAATLGASWSQFPRVNALDLRIVTNAAQGPSSGSTGSDYYNPTTYGPDAEAGYTIAALVSNVSERFELFLRASNPSSASGTGYRLRVTRNAGPVWAWTLWRLETVNSVQLNSTVPTTALTVGDKVGLEVIGTVLTAYRWDGSSWASVVTYDTAGDATKFSTAGNIGMSINGANGRVDDFFGGAVVTGGGGGSTVKALAALGVG